jgi:hypothetical protein
MAKTILLDTRTANFLDLVGNGKIHRVPAYQRDYSWKEEHWEDLWNDLWSMRNDPDERHYMGALVIEGTSDREFLIIDGQQRLATLSVLALAVLQQLLSLAGQGVDPDANRERAAALRNRFIGEKDPASLVESSKLFLNETDNAFYQDYLVQLRAPLNPRGLPKSNKLLWACFEYFLKQINGVDAFRQGGGALAALLNETIARQLLFILITVDDELNAYTVFETLNARGLELSSTDLLKNYLFSRVQVRADLDALQRRWRRLIATVRQERFPEFLRYHLLCEHRQVRRQRLFKMVRKTVSSGQQVFDLMDALEARAEFFSALSDPSHSYWLDNPACRPFVRELNLFGVRQMTPLLFAAWERFSAENFARVLKIASVVSFRYTVVSGLNTNELEPVYHYAAKAVLDRVATKPADVFAKLRSIYVDDDKFRHNFAMMSLDTGGRRKKIAKYILARLESDASGRDCDPDTDPATIEHILPENPSRAWENTYPEGRWDEDVYRLGNLTLLESSANRRIGNADYLEKLAEYAASGYALTQALARFAPEHWTPELVNARQRDMAARAAHLWRADFV